MSEDYREKTVREFLGMIKEPIIRENLCAGIVESLKLDRYTEDEIYQMKVKDMWEKLKDVIYQLSWLNIMAIEKIRKKHEDRKL